MINITAYNLKVLCFIIITKKQNSKKNLIKWSANVQIHSLIQQHTENLLCTDYSSRCY